MDDDMIEFVTGMNEEAIFFDGYEDAIIGVAERCSQPALVVYDAAKCIEILVTRDGMSWEDAEEFFSFNTLGCWAGENTPLFLWRPQWDLNPPDRAASAPADEPRDPPPDPR